MYSEQDFIDIGRRIRRNRLVWGPVTLALAALCVVGLVLRVKGLAIAAGTLLAGAVCFGFAYFQLPCLRYRKFLQGLRDGLTREMTGTLLSVADAPELQDGARVLHVHLRLADQDDERIVYLNASKREGFPSVGERVKLKLCGRHIRDAEAL
ncbi:MAG: hypothetical protein IJ646_10695 [Clostridia bacterium]|nr:hypothetical protein [Clostridia bacterium]